MARSKHDEDNPINLLKRIKELERLVKELIHFNDLILKKDCPF